MKHTEKVRFAIGKSIGRLFATVALFVIICILVYVAGNQNKETQPLEIQGFAFDTTYKITLYQGGSKEILQNCVELCGVYENCISPTVASSEVAQINAISQDYDALLTKQQRQMITKGKAKVFTQKECKQLTNAIEKQRTQKKEMIPFSIAQNGRISFTISETIEKLAQESLQYGQKSNGKFAMTIWPVSRLWNFEGENLHPPAKSAILQELTRVQPDGMVLGSHTLHFQKPGMGIEFGAIAKGYIADRIKAYLVQEGVTSGLIDLGGNIVCIGNKQGGEAFRIGIQQPFADRNEVIGTVKVKDVSVVSSGIYERCFTDKGTFYHHILDPDTGYPVENDLLAVTIISPTSVEGDGLSTTCFGLGLEKGMECINATENVEAVFITKDEKMHYSRGYAKYQ